MNKEKSSIISNIINMILEDNKAEAKAIIQQEYPHSNYDIEKRSYTVSQKMKQFISDGFIDRYTGEKLLNPGVLKIISIYFPDEFPYHSHWKMSQTHMAYWDLIPTIDHIYPIAKGGEDDESNWVTTSMKNNSIKSNYTIDEINWSLFPRGNIYEWDGLTESFIKLVDKDKDLLEDSYIRIWYNVSKKELYKNNTNS